MKTNHFLFQCAFLLAGCSISFGEGEQPGVSSKTQTPQLAVTMEQDKAIDAAVAEFKKAHEEELKTIVPAPAAQGDDAPPADVELKSTGKDMVITNEGDIYIDLEKEGIVIYYKNIKARSEKYNLTCDKELRAYLEPEKEEKKTAEKQKPSGDEAGEKEQKKKGDDDSFKGIKTNFKDVKKVSAFGNVVFQGKDKKGKEIEARADQIVCDLKTGEILLTGGFPLLVSDKMGIQCIKSGGTIRRSKDGKVWTNGPTKTVIKDIDTMTNKSKL